MKVLFFSPFSGVLPHIKSEVLLADGLRREGHDISFVNCDGIFKDFCVCMSANGLNEFSDAKIKKDCCSSCRYIRDWNNSHFKFKNQYIEGGLLETEKTEIKRLINILNRENWHNFVYDGFEIGKIASYEFLINYKKNDFKLSDAEWSAYMFAFKNTLITYFVLKKIIESKKPDVVMYYDAGYSVNGVVKALALKFNILAYDYFGSLSIPDRYSRLVITKEDSSKLFNHLKKNVWDNYKNNTSTQKEIVNTGRHFKALFKARDVFVYSNARDKTGKNIRKIFSVSPVQKLLVATLSSYDERFAEDVLGRTTKESATIFSSQVEWCASLVEWIKNKPNYFLIIRVHPREFPNKREGVKSVHTEKLQKIFCKLPDNVKINWPTDNLSIYNLAEEADVFLNAWSSVGTEMSLLGLPVVVYSDKLLYYPFELNYLGTTKEMYFDKIEEAISDGWSFEHIRMAYRWYTIIFCLSSIKISEKFRVTKNVLRRGFGLLGKITKFKIFNKLACIFYIDSSRFSKTSIKLVEKMIETKAQSLADLYYTEDKNLVSIENETKYIKAEMEKLYRGAKSNILEKVRDYHSK